MTAGQREEKQQQHVERGLPPHQAGTDTPFPSRKHGQGRPTETQGVENYQAGE